MYLQLEVQNSPIPAYKIEVERSVGEGLHKFYERTIRRAVARLRDNYGFNPEIKSIKVRTDNIKNPALIYEYPNGEYIIVISNSIAKNRKGYIKEILQHEVAHIFAWAIYDTSAHSNEFAEVISKLRRRYRENK